MKRCPQCGTTYTDATLKYCLTDGSSLEDADAGAPPTRREGLKIDIPAPPTASGSISEPARGGISTAAKVAIALAIFAVIGAVLIVAAAIMIFVAGDILSARQPVDSPSPPPTAPTPAPSPSPTDAAEELTKKLEELAKKIEEQNSPIEVPKIPLKDVLGDDSAATVNSPNDGFLALRSLPSTDIGERIGRIPHGSQVVVVSCDEERERVAGRRGRWCLVEWEQRVGWVFDAWLTFR